MGALSTSKVTKTEIQRFWAGRVPLVEPSTNPEDLGRDYFLRIDRTYLRYNPFLEEIRRNLAKRGKTVLEIGCGAGADSRAFAKLGLRVISLDLNHRSCEITKQGFEVFGISADVVQADAENLPFRENSVDLAYSFGVLHHTPNTQEAVQELHRVVKYSAFVMLYNRNLSYYAKRIRHIGRSQQEIFNMYDYTVLSKLYTKAEVRAMFSSFHGIKIKSRMFWGGKDSRFLYFLLIVMHVTGIERIYGSFNLIWLDKISH